MHQSIPGLCRVWVRLKDPANPYWSRMTYAPRSYWDCLRIKQKYEMRFTDREYLITADHDLCQPLVQRTEVTA